MEKSKRETRRKLKDIKKKSDFLKLVEDANLTEEEIAIACMAFIGGHGYGFIADATGYSERTIKRRMEHILKILS